PSMLVAEGVFTTLSAVGLFGLPGWALLSANNLAVWSPPAGARRVLVAADRGAAGERAAAKLAARLRAAGRSVRVIWPEAPFGDWNEAASAAAGQREE
ncbi:MAG: toprim domain-containing protein, partial [Brevundimonas sp.]